MQFKLMRLGLRDLPNIITIARICAVVPLMILLNRQQYQLALLVACVAGASDAVDGFLAKQFGWTSRIGGILDPIADKFLLVGCFAMLALQSHLPVWLFWLVIGRDLLIVAGGTIYYWTIAKVDASPTLLSKLNTCCQILLVLLALLGLVYQWVDHRWMVWMTWVVALSTTLSGLQYVWIWGIKAWSETRKGVS